MKKQGYLQIVYQTFYGEVKSIDSFPPGEPYKYLWKSPKIPHPSHIRKAIASIDQTTVFQMVSSRNYPFK